MDPEQIQPPAQPAEQLPLFESMLQDQVESNAEQQALMETQVQQGAETNQLLETGLEQSANNSEKIADAISKLANPIAGAEFIAAFLKAITGPKGEKGDTPVRGKDYYTTEEIKSIAKEIQDKIRVPVDGKTPEKGVDYFTPEEVNEIIDLVQNSIRIPEDGKPGEPGKDADPPDIDEIVRLVLEKIPKSKQPKIKEKEITTEQIIKLIKNKLSYNDLRDLPTIFKGAGMAGAGYLSNLSDVQISTTPTNGQTLVYDAAIKMWKPGAAGGGGTWGSITGTLSDQTDLQTALNAKGDLSGPASSTDTAIALFNGVTGKLLKNSGILVDGSNNMVFPSAATISVGHIFLNSSYAAGNGHIRYDGGGASVYNELYFSGANNSVRFGVALGDADRFAVDDSTNLISFGWAAVPMTTDGAALGTTALMWSDLFLADGAVINFNNGNYTITHSAGLLTFGGPITAQRFVPNSSTVPSNGMYLPAANTLGFAASSAGEVQLTSTAFSPMANDGNALGTTTLGWADIFLATGAVINVANGNAVITHSSGIFTVSTGDLRVTTAGTNTASVVTVGGTQTLTAKTLTSPVINTGTVGTSLLPTANDGAALGAAATAFSDLFLASGAVIGFNNGDVTITHSADALTIAGGTLVLGEAQWTNGTSIRTAQSAGNTLFLRAYDVDGATYVTFATLTANNTPTMTLNGVTSDSAWSPTTNDGAALGSSTLGWADLYLATGGNILVNNANAKRTIVLSAAGGAPATTSGCSAPTKVEAGTNDIDYWVLDFDTTTEERAFWVIAMPDNWDGSTLLAKFYWTNAAGLTTETVRWAIKARAYADDAAIDQASGSEATVDDTWLAQGDVHITADTGAITVAGSPAGGQLVQFIVSRKTASDNLTGDARLMMVKIEYGINAYSD